MTADFDILQAFPAPLHPLSFWSLRARAGQRSPDVPADISLQKTGKMQA